MIVLLQFSHYYFLCCFRIPDCVANVTSLTQLFMNDVALPALPREIGKSVTMDMPTCTCTCIFSVHVHVYTVYMYSIFHSVTCL